MGDILFSVIIPSFNRVHIIERAIEAVLQQTYQNFELLVVDDGSTDHTQTIIEPYLKDQRIKYIYQNNGGVCAARNKGALNSTGDYLIFFDSDDFVEETWLEDFYNIKDHNYDIIFCNMKVIKADNTIKLVSCLDPYNNKSSKGISIPGSWSIKKDIFLTIGMYDEKLKYGENTELRFRLDEAKPKIGLIDKYNFIYYESIDGGSKNIKNIFTSCQYLLKKHPFFFDNSIKNKFIYFNVIVVNGIILKEYKIASHYLVRAFKMKPFYLKNYYRMIKLIYSYSMTKLVDFFKTKNQIEY
jgi:glycosyltransferase involved in cell wall biosynthesis